MLLVPQRVLDREHAAPGVPEQEEVVPVQPQRLADLLDLVHEARQLPQLRLVRLVAVEGAELVVVVVLDPRRRQIAVEGLEVLVRRARPAVQQQQLHRRRVADRASSRPGTCPSASRRESSGRRRSGCRRGRCSRDSSESSVDWWSLSAPCRHESRPPVDHFAASGMSSNPVNSVEESKPRQTTCNHAPELRSIDSSADLATIRQSSSTQETRPAVSAQIVRTRPATA